jgi:hypothetical protein
VLSVRMEGRTEGDLRRIETTVTSRIAQFLPTASEV